MGGPVKLCVEGVVWRYGHSEGGNGHPRGRRFRRHIWESRHWSAFIQAQKYGTVHILHPSQSYVAHDTHWSKR
jgi:hypothetical protein